MDTNTMELNLSEMENAAGGKLFPAKDLAGESLESYIKKALLEALK